MTKGEAKTLIRLLAARGDFEPLLLDYFLDLGRRELEGGRSDNFYWMRASKEFNLVINQGDYVITAPPVSISDFKMVRYVLWKDPTLTGWRQIPSYELDLLDTNYDTNSNGSPEAYNLDDQTFKVFPVDPDKAYNMKFYYWKWTANPTNDIATDELLTRWPEALINASVAHALLVLTREPAQAEPWFKLYEREKKKIQEYDRLRSSEGELHLIPSSVPILRIIMPRQVNQPGQISRWSSY